MFSSDPENHTLLTKMSFDLEANLKHLPAKPGVYLHKDSLGNVIYVGKATSLRNRVRQYFTSPEGMDPKTQALVKHISEFEYIITSNEAEALILENNLIKKYRPRYNVMLVDDKTYPYLKITYGEIYPRLIKTRTLTGGEGSKYFGPYADVGALNRIIGLLNDSYRLKRCSRSRFPDDWRPCLNGFVGACDRYCMEDSPSSEEYAARIGDVSEFLKGHNKKLVAGLKSRMKEASDSMDFEAAAKIRDMITSANAVIERQKVDLLSSGNMDICLASDASAIVSDASAIVSDASAVKRGAFAIASDASAITSDASAVKSGASVTESDASVTKSDASVTKSDASVTPRNEDPKLSVKNAKVTLFFVRDGRLTGREMHRLEAEEGAAKKEIAAAFLKQYYADQTMFPKEILLEEAIDDMKAIEEWLADTAGHRIKILVPVRGDKAALLKLAQKDFLETEALAEDVFINNKAREKAAEDELLRLAGFEDRASLSRLPSGHTSGIPSGIPSEVSQSEGDRPLRIEAYDISHTGGEDSVGAMVVFLGAEKNKKDYRRFKIRTTDESGKSADDYASLQEVLYRRLKRGLAGEKGFSELPDVILVDGGKGHVAAANQIIDALIRPLSEGEQPLPEGDQSLSAGDRPLSSLERPYRPPCLGMVKDERHRTRGLVTEDSEIDLADKPELYHLIGTIQEEVHRFAVEYHRGKRGKSLIKSELDGISGIGEKRKMALLLKYGGIDAMKTATAEELAQVPGMNRKAADAVLSWIDSTFNTSS
jgi:excinuclease ABC subunit C